MELFVVTEETVSGALKYLGQRPYLEVRQIIESLMMSRTLKQFDAERKAALKQIKKERRGRSSGHSKANPTNQAA